MNDQLKCITVEELEFALWSIYSYIKTQDIRFLENAQREIKLAKEIDYSIKTYQEYEENKFIESTHGPGRKAMFFIDSLLEMYLDDGIITIYGDDPVNSTITHNNTYKLSLKDKDTHTSIYNTNPTADSEPYDFNATFIKQITVYTDKVVDTTAHAYDSIGLNKGYRAPIRKFEAKGFLWKKGHEHFANYILHGTKDCGIKLLDRVSNTEKKFEFTPSSSEKLKYLDKYYYWINLFPVFEFLIWDTYILD